jgi:large subunit ribosomal protein L25
MEITAQKRDTFGKATRRLRDKGLIPAELYGKGVENIHLTVPVNEFTKLYKEAGSNTVVNLKVGTVIYPTVIHDVQRHFVKGTISHIDLYKVRLDEKIKAMVPLEFVGEAPAVKADGAVLNKAMMELEVEALPTDLPRRLTIDLSVLDALDKTIYVKDIKVPKGVVVMADEDAAVITAAAPREEKVEAVAADVTAVKVETEEKKEQRAAEKGAVETATK